MAEDSIRKLEDNLAFKHMTTAAADKTAVDFLSKPDRVSSKDVHNMLMTAGFTPDKLESVERPKEIEHQSHGAEPI